MKKILTTIAVVTLVYSCNSKNSNHDKTPQTQEQKEDQQKKDEDTSLTEVCTPDHIKRNGECVELTQEDCKKFNNGSILVDGNCIKPEPKMSEADCKVKGLTFNEIIEECSYSLVDFELLKTTGECSECNLKRIIMSDFEGTVSIQKSALRYSQWQKSKLTESSFKGSHLAKTDFGHSSLNGVDFSSTILRGVKIDFANLTNVSFEGSLAIGIDFNGSQLDSVSFKEARLTFASFRGADLNDIDFEGAYLGQTDFSFSTGADLSSVPQESLCGAVMPDGKLNPPCE